MNTMNYPQEYLDAVEIYRDCFSEPQFDNFCRYLFGLAINESKKNIETINDSFVEVINQATLNNFVTDSPWDYQKLRNKRITLINQMIEKYCFPEEEIVLILDDIVIPKTGKNMEGSGYFYSTTAGRSIWGHNFVSSFISCFPIYSCVDVWQYFKTEFCDKNEMQFKKKTDAAADQIIEYNPPENRSVTVTFDSFYLCKKVIRPIKARNWQWISRLKIDRVIYYHDTKMTVADLLKRCVKELEYRGVDVEGRKFYTLPPVDIYIPDVGQAQLLFVKPPGTFDNKDDLYTSDPYPYVCSDESLHRKKVLWGYVQRSCIENGYRDEKQNLGLGEYQVRKLKGIYHHAQLVFTIHPLLIYMSLKQTGDIRLITIGEICTWLRQLRDRENVKWIYEQFQNGASLKDTLVKLGL